ncbi:MAG: DUF3667 domain-containing protein [Flavobacteriaceae bacterium]|nr:DUF3667 domain-containing protein [Flavobacteriaceae bacterium]
MNCKNCNFELNQKDLYCNECGAKIITTRITVKSLFSNFIGVLGWDNNFFVTLRNLLFKPQIVFNEYIGGTRKKHANPFSLFAIMVAISLFVFSQYSEELIQLSTATNFQQTEIIEPISTDNLKETKDQEIFGYKSQNAFNEALMKVQMKYYNLISFLFLPLYTLIAFLVFRKPFNFGEHLIINTYIQSVTTFFSVLLFVFSLLTGINIFGTGILIVPFIYYSYAYQRLYNLSFGQLLLKILKFIGVTIIVAIIPIIIAVAYIVVNK